jgi:hypothetical protein
MNKWTEWVIKVIEASELGSAHLMRYAQEKDTNRPWVSKYQVRKVWDCMPPGETEGLGEGIEGVTFEEVTRYFNRKLKEKTMGLSRVATPSMNNEITGVPCGTDYNGRTVVAVRLREDGGNWALKSCAFFVDPKLEPVSGDIVVVDVQNCPSTGIVVSRELSSMDLARACKWVIGKIDMTAHNNRLERERQLKAMNDKMEARVKSVEKYVKYRMLAQQDPEMARMYVDMQQLDPSMPDLPEGTKVAEIE